MRTKLLCVLLVVLSWPALAQTTATRVSGNARLTNSLIVSSVLGTKLFTIQGYNAASATQYIQVFQTNAVPPNASVPTFSFPVASSNYFSMDFGQYGADLDRIMVVVSTNAATLGIGATNACALQAITRR